MPIEIVSMTRMYPGGAGCKSTTKGPTSIFPCLWRADTGAGGNGLSVKVIGSRKTSAWLEETLSEGRVSSGGKMMMNRTHGCVSSSVVLLRYAYELGNCYF